MKPQSPDGSIIPNALDMEPQEYSLDLSNVCLDLNDNDEYSEFMDSYTSHDFPFLTSITNNSHNTLEISSNADSLNSLDDSTSWVFDPQYQDLEPDSDRRANSFPSTSTVFDQTLNQIQDHEPKDLCSTTKRNNKPGRGFTEYVFRTEFKSTRTPRKGSFIPKRRGPLAPKTREVAKEIRSIGACWRCKILKTSCDGATPCSACPRDWSNSNWKEVQCRRTLLPDLADRFVPCDMIVPAPRTSLLLPENSQIMVFAVKDLDEIFRGIEEFREACCIPRREGTSDLFELLRCAMVYQEITSETDLIRHAMHCLRACLRIRHSQEHRQSPHTVHPNDSTLKIQEYREIRDSVRFYLRKLQCTMFVRGGIRRHKHWLSIFYSLCIQSIVRIVLSHTLEWKNCRQDQTAEDKEPRNSEILPFYQLLVKVFALSSGSFDPLVEGWHSASDDTERWRVEHYQEARRALNTEQWPKRNISGSSGYLESLFDEKSGYSFLL